jgi:hypothetical protein
VGKQKPYGSKMEKFDVVGRNSGCAQSTDKHLHLSHSLLVTSLKKKKLYNNINIWRYRHKGGDISASTAGAKPIATW